MNRKKQTVLFLLMTVLLSVGIILLLDIYFSPQQVFTQYLRGMGHPPVEKMLLEKELPDESVFMAGIYEDNLMIVEAEKDGFFWKYRAGRHTGMSYAEDKFYGYLYTNGIYVGICADPAIKEIYMLGGDLEKWEFQEYTCPVDEDGFFFCETELNTENDYDIYAEGRNAEGEVIAKNGREGIARQVWKGVTAAERPQLTKPFITAPEG